MKDLVMNLEQQWLGCWRGMMLGVLTNDDDKRRLKSAATKFLAKIDHPSGDEQLVQVNNRFNVKRVSGNANLFWQRLQRIAM